MTHSPDDIDLTSDVAIEYLWPALECAIHVRPTRGRLVHSIENDSVDSQAAQLRYTRITISHVVAKMEKEYNLSKSSEIDKIGRTVAFLQD